jgi:hypothetical protein
MNTVKKKLPVSKYSKRPPAVTVEENVELTGVLKNRVGKWCITTSLPEDSLAQLIVPGQGMYGWMTETEFKKSKGAIGKTKVGQFGTNAKDDGVSAVDTIYSYLGPMSESIVIVWHKLLTPEELSIVGSAYKLEQLVHKQLGKPIQEGNSKEFWNTSASRIIEVVNKILKPKPLISFIGSPDQELAINKMINNKSRYFGLFATMRHGKSYDYLEYIKRTYSQGRKHHHLVFCHDTKTYNGWLKKIENTYSDCMIAMELKSNKDIDFNKEPEKNTIVLVSPQLIAASESKNGEIDFNKNIESFSKKYKIRGENIFVDEAHNYFTPRWEQYYESIVGAGQIILATGTPANLIVRHQDKFDEYNVFEWGIDMLVAKLLKDLNIELTTNIKLIQLKNSDGSDFNIANLTGLDDGKLANYRHFESMVKKLLDGNSKFSPFFYKDKHFLAVVDTVVSAETFKELIILYGKDKIVPILVAGKNRDVKDEAELNQMIEAAERDNKFTITLTCGSMVQGTAVRLWKNILNFSSKSTYEIYFQLIGRGYEFDSKNDNHHDKQKPFKVSVNMWDYNPHRIYNVISEYVDARAKHNGDDQDEALKHFFEIVCIEDFVHERRAWEEKDVIELSDKVKEILNQKINRRGLTIDTCFGRTFDIRDMGSLWVDFAASKKWSGARQEKIRKEVLDLWEQDLKKQKKDHSVRLNKNLEDTKSKSVEDLYKIVKDSVQSCLSKLDIVWAVFKSRGLVKTNINELFVHSGDPVFLDGIGLDNKELADVFISVIKKHGLIDKINEKLKKSEILKAEKLLTYDLSEFLKHGDTFEKMFNYGGDDTQVSVRIAYEILKKELIGIKAKKGDVFQVPYSKSGAINLALAYLLMKDSKKIFGEQLTNRQIINSINFDEDNKFFSTLNETMGFKKNMKKKMKFIIINPPYKNGLHIEIFNRSVEELEDFGELFCIQPSTPFVNRKPTRDDDKTKKIKENVSKYRTRLTLVDGNRIFKNAGFFTPLSMTRLKKVLDKKIEVVYSHIDSTNKEVKTYDKLDDIFIHGNDIVLKIRDKIFSKMTTSIYDKLSRRGSFDKFYFKINTVAGNVSRTDGKINPDFYCMIYKENENNISDFITDLSINGDLNYVSVSTREAAKNCGNYLLTKFARFCVSLYKMNVQFSRGELMAVPYMDFSQEWTDEKLFDYFELTQEERDFINTYIQDWYDRDFK